MYYTCRCILLSRNSVLIIGILNLVILEIRLLNLYDYTCLILGSEILKNTINAKGKDIAANSRKGS